MNLRLLLVVFTICGLILLAGTSELARAQQFVQYKVQISPDGSGSWTITQASGPNGTIDSWHGFQLKVDDLVSLAANLTERDMRVDPNSLQLSTVWGNESQTTDYQFTWLNFSIVQNEKITVGDVFGIGSFFSQLYGDGELQIILPPEYSVASVSPQPNGGNNAPDTLDWLGTEFFISGNPNLILTIGSSSPTPTQNTSGLGWQFYAVAGVVAAFGASALSVGLYVFRRRKNKTSVTNSTTLSRQQLIVESEEEKIVRVLQTSGGSAFQSTISEQCRFSKSKTSQLLSTLERKGAVTRYKRGRDKIVTLIEQGKCKGESP